MPETVFACTHVEKCAEVDVYNDGVDPKTCVCTISESCNIQAATLPGLLQRLSETWFINIDDVFVPDEGGEVTRISYNRLENADGDEPTKEQKRKWKRGKETLYLADYYFAIEKRTVEPVTLTDFAGVKFHQ